jgi:hypothetical protein
MLMKLIQINSVMKQQTAMNRMSVRNNWKTTNGVYCFHSPDVLPGNCEQHLLKKLIAGRFTFNECHFVKWNLFVCDV